MDQEDKRWRGLRPGDPVKLEEPPGRVRRTRFTFVRHVLTETDEYVEIRDPQGRPRYAYPDRVRTLGGRTLPPDPEPEESADGGGAS